MKLSIKILIAFVLTALLSVTLTVGMIRYFADRNFEDYILRKELETLDLLTPLLAAHYQSHGDWERLRGNPRLWHDLLRSGIGDGSVELERREPGPPRPPDFRREENRGGPQRSDPLRAAPPRPDGRDRPGQPPARGEPQSPPQGRRPPPPQRQISPPWDNLHMLPRVALFDLYGKRIEGADLAFEEVSTKAIENYGEKVGWVGLLPGREFNHPLDKAFIQRQTNYYYLIGGVVLILAVAAALVLSRYMTAPIRRLAGAVEDLKKRRFETRIEVTSSDELGRLADDINSLARELGAYQTRQQQWLSDIAHELRTPLSVLVGEIEAIQDGLRQADPETLDSLHAEAVHISAIVDDLHQLSLAESGGLTFKQERIRPLAVLEETLERWKPRLERAGFEVAAELNRLPAITVTGDPGRLTQVFSNLLQNILNHSQTPGLVGIRAETADGRLIIRIEDSGPGVAPDELGRLFDRLYKADRSRRRSGSGSGLGLAVVKAVVEAHGGTVGARAGGRDGLLIEIDLPIA